MNPRLQYSMHRIVGGISCLLMAAFAFFGQQPMTFVDENGKITGVYDLTVWLRLFAGVALAVGVALLVWGIWRWFDPKPQPEQANAGFLASLRTRFFADGPLWLIFNVAEILFAAYAGFRMGAEVGSEPTTPDRFLCISLLVVWVVFVIGIVSLASKPLRVPSLNRFSLSWNKDPLQVLFISTLMTLALIMTGLGRAGVRGISAFAPYESSLVGLLIGQAIVYWAFRREIQDNALSVPQHSA